MVGCIDLISTFCLHMINKVQDGYCERTCQPKGLVVPVWWGMEMIGMPSEL